MKRKVLGIAIMAVAATLVFAKSTKLVMSWKNPSYSQTTKYHRVLALGLSNRVGVRADFEDALAAELASTGLEAIAGNTIFLRPPGTQLDLNYVREQVRANQIDVVVVSRLIKVENTTTYIPGTPYFLPYYNTFYGYYGTLYPVVYSPGYLLEEKRVRVETNVYATSPPDGVLIWTGTTDTFNPSDVHKAIKGLVNLVVTKMQKDGVL